MYLEDLAPCRVTPIDSEPTAKSIGWLDQAYPFPTGDTSKKFRSILRRLVKDIKNPMWGFHECEFCEGRRSQGNGEIHVVGPDGTIYIAPQLVVHYVEIHNYLPTQEFIDAILSSSR
jgi:hypothetical protein